MLNEAKFTGSVTEIKPSPSGGVTLKVANRLEQEGRMVTTHLQLMLRKDCQQKVIDWGIQVGDVVRVEGKLVQGKRDLTLLVLNIHQENTEGQVFFTDPAGLKVLVGGVNEVKVRGNLGSDPSLNVTEQGVPVRNFSLAMNQTWSKTKNTKNTKNTNTREASPQKPVWVRVAAFGEASDQAKALAKGNLTEVHGRMVMENRAGGETMQVKATQVRFIPRKTRTDNTHV